MDYFSKKQLLHTAVNESARNYAEGKKLVPKNL